MTDAQNAFFQMAAAVKAVTDSFTTAWSATPSFATPHDLLISNVLAKQPGAAGQQQQSSKGVTADKKTARAALEAHLESLAASIEAYAISIANGTLTSEAHLPHSIITRATDDELLGMEKRISALAADNLSHLAAFGVTSTRITALDLDATTFANFIGKPRATRSVSADGTKQIAALVDLGRAYLEAMDGQMILFKDSAPDFCSQYADARRQITTGSRHRAVYFSVTDSEHRLLPGVVVHIAAAHLTRVTSANGTCFIQSIAPGSYQAELSKFGYGPLSVTVNVNASETAHVNVSMSAQP